MTVFLHIFGQACCKPIVFSAQSDHDEIMSFLMAWTGMVLHLWVVSHPINQCDMCSPHSNSNESQQYITIINKSSSYLHYTIFKHITQLLWTH